MIPLTRAIPERIRGGLRRCAIQIDVYVTLLYTHRHTDKHTYHVTCDICSSRPNDVIIIDPITPYLPRLLTNSGKRPFFSVKPYTSLAVK